MPRDAHGTREQIMRAAERLFAQYGYANVSLKGINEAAGQLNKSALQYHFGSREGVLAAILREHLVNDDVRTDAAVKVLREQPEVSTYEVMAAATSSILDLLKQGQRGYDVSRICCELGMQLEGGPPTLRKVLGRRPDTVNPFRALLKRANPALNEDVLELRFHLAVRMAFAVVSDRAAELSGNPGHKPLLSHEEFAENLISMLAAAVSAPSGAPDIKGRDDGPARVS
jgi:AcrR family transcriptional regulator